MDVWIAAARGAFRTRRMGRWEVETSEHPPANPQASDAAATKRMSRMKAILTGPPGAAGLPP